MNNKSTLAVMLAAALTVSGCAQTPQKLDTPTKNEVSQPVTIKASENTQCDTIECSENDSSMLMDELF